MTEYCPHITTTLVCVSVTSGLSTSGSAVAVCQNSVLSVPEITVASGEMMGSPSSPLLLVRSLLFCTHTVYGSSITHTYTLWPKCLFRHVLWRDPYRWPWLYIPSGRRKEGMMWKPYKNGDEKREWINREKEERESREVELMCRKAKAWSLVTHWLTVT